MASQWKSWEEWLEVGKARLVGFLDEESLKHCFREREGQGQL